jgi:glucosamine 6-phosphate synthetase-like amidotransferase/phosphosugar isomerase protein
MCGIVYRKSFIDHNVAQDVLHMYKNQRSRGTEGFGFYIPKTNKLKHETIEKNMVRLLKKTSTTEMLFHHRMPTSTDNVMNACHPFRVVVDNTEYVVVHNGYLFNEDNLKDKHEKLGYKYSSLQPDKRFNDSEALAYDIALYLAGKQKKLYAEGAIAFIATENGRTHFGRNNGSPLVCHINDKFLTIRSEGRGASVKTNTLYTFENGKTSEKKLNIPEYSYSYEWKPVPTYDPNNYTKYSATYEEDDYVYIAQDIADIEKEIAKCQTELARAEIDSDSKQFTNSQWLIAELEYELDGLKQFQQKEFVL